MIANKVGWRIVPDRCALLIHDMQPHYLAVLPEPARARITGNMRGLAAACLDRDIPVFASQVPHTPRAEERGLMAEMWGGGPPASDGLDPWLGLAERPVRRLTKRSYSAFYGSGFDVSLRRLGRDSVVIVGVYTSIGCHYSAVDAFARDIRAFLVSDATADLNETAHAAGLAAAAATCARIVGTEEVMRALGALTDDPVARNPDAQRPR